MPLSPKAAIKEVQELSFLTAKAFTSMFRRPYYVRDILMQMDLIGVGSLTVVMLTGFFTGAVLTLQTSKELSRFGAVGFHANADHDEAGVARRAFEHLLDQSWDADAFEDQRGLECRQ